MTQYDTKHLAVVDPRTLDGDPFTVAQKAAEQVAALAALAGTQAGLAELMHRNSLMEAILQDGGKLTPETWEKAAYSKKWAAVQTLLEGVSKEIVTLGKAAGYDPKHPPKEGS